MHHTPRWLPGGSLARWLLAGVAGMLPCACATPAGPPALTAAVPSLRRQHLERIDGLVAEALAAGDLPGCVVSIGDHRGVYWQRAYGDRVQRPVKVAMSDDTLFDLASLTKPIATAASLFVLVEQGLVQLDAPVASYWPEFGAAGKEAITLRHLLTHTAGLLPDTPLTDYQNGREAALLEIARRPPSVPPGSRFLYSDVGYQVLGEVIERRAGLPLDVFARQHLFEPLGMTSTCFRPSAAAAARAAPTEPREGREGVGEVHDPRARAMGGVAGHAGLFATAADLGRFASMLLCRGEREGVRVLSRAAVEAMTAPQPVPGGLRTLGWDMATSFSKNRSDLMSTRAFGHGGFTGTVLWIDPEIDLFVLFLSSRLHPDGEGDVNRLAARIGSVAVAACEPGGPAVEPVVLGIDVLVREGFVRLQGKRVGLITNQTGRDSAGVRTVDRFLAAPGVQLVALFSPEHGLEGMADGRVEDSSDADSGVPVHSLYGDARKPSAENLRGIDALVFDIQDAGARFYTYISTLGLCLEAAAEAGVEFWVLDRPNPLGGVRVEGPLIDAGRESFTAFLPLPVIHGMSVAELACYFQQELHLPARLEIVRCEHWVGQPFDATGLRWTQPSPNLRSLTQAFLYPGVALLEFSNLSVGRGTDTPFQRVGAPWMDGSALAKELQGRCIPGVSFVPVEFTPDSSRFAGERCQGVEILLVDRARFRPVFAGFELIAALWKLFPERFDLDACDRLIARAPLLEALREGHPTRVLEHGWQAELRQFLERRAPVLLYPRVE